MDEKKTRNEDLYRLVGVLKDLQNEGLEIDLGSKMLESILDARDKFDLDARIYKGIQEYGKVPYVDSLIGFYNRMANNPDVIDWMTNNKFPLITDKDTFVLPKRPIPISPSEMSIEEINEQLLPFILQYNGYDKSNFEDFFTDRQMMREPSFLRTFFGIHNYGVNDKEFLDGVGLNGLNTSSKDPVLWNHLIDDYIVTDNDDDEQKLGKRKALQKLRRDMGWYGSDEELLQRLNDLAVRGQFNYYDNNGEIDSLAEVAQMVAQYLAPSTMDAFRNGDTPNMLDAGLDIAMIIPNLLGGALSLGGKGLSALLKSNALKKVGNGLSKNPLLKNADEFYDVFKHSLKGVGESPYFKLGGDIIRDVATEAVPFAIANGINEYADSKKEKTYTTEDEPFVTNEFADGFNFNNSVQGIYDGSKIGGILSSLPVSLIRGGKALKHKNAEKELAGYRKNWTKKKKQKIEEIEKDDKKFDNAASLWKFIFGKTYDPNRTPYTQDDDVKKGRDMLDLYGKKYGN